MYKLASDILIQWARQRQSAMPIDFHLQSRNFIRIPTASLISPAPIKPSKLPPLPPTLQQQKLKVCKGRSTDIRTEKQKQIGTSVARHLNCRERNPPPADYHTN